MVKLYIVERIGEDLREPDQSRLQILANKKLHGTEYQRAKTDCQPHQCKIVNKARNVSVRLENSEKARVRI